MVRRQTSDVAHDSAYDRHGTRYTTTFPLILGLSSPPITEPVLMHPSSRVLRAYELLSQESDIPRPSPELTKSCPQIEK